MCTPEKRSLIPKVNSDLPPPHILLFVIFGSVYGIIAGGLCLLFSHLYIDSSSLSLLFLPNKKKLEELPYLCGAPEQSGVNLEKSNYNIKPNPKVLHSGLLKG